jgi:DAACS family dicarboxylate/amino acid:cation (Na+ or H+) symporter
MIAGVLAGILVRYFYAGTPVIPTLIEWIKPIGDIFLRLIFMMVIPLIIAAIVLGVSDMGDLSKLGRIGGRMLVYTISVTSVSVLLGVFLTILVKPGSNISPQERQVLVDQYSQETKKISETAAQAHHKNFTDVIVSIVPKNPLEDMVRAFDPTYTGGGLLSVMFMALMMGIAMAYCPPEKVQVFRDTLEGLYEIVMKIIGYAMRFAPYGIASLLFVLTVNLGYSILGVLLKYVLLVIFALAIQQFVIYTIILKLFTKMKPGFFFKNIREVMITAFSTSSSNATLPTAIRVTTEKLKIPREVTNFVLTVGSTGNQNGTALYEGITLLFLAQVFDVHLSIAQQILVVIISVLSGIGTAGVPGGTMPVMMVILYSLGIPGEAIALIYGVDRILDMSRTVLNVTGDITATVFIHAQEEKKKL